MTRGDRGPASSGSSSGISWRTSGSAAPSWADDLARRDGRCLLGVLEGEVEGDASQTDLERVLPVGAGADDRRTESDHPDRPQPRPAWAPSRLPQRGLLPASSGIRPSTGNRLDRPLALRRRRRSARHIVHRPTGSSRTTFGTSVVYGWRSDALRQRRQHPRLERLALGEATSQRGRELLGGSGVLVRDDAGEVAVQRAGHEPRRARRAPRPRRPASGTRAACRAWSPTLRSCAASRSSAYSTAICAARAERLRPPTPLPPPPRLHRRRCRQVDGEERSANARQRRAAAAHGSAGRAA